jgi:ubiquinone/menaquinone biosynthesis C-methylase UbiE
MNKTIHRGESATKIFDHRTLERDYSTLLPILKKGLRVLDAGCGTGAISQGIARRVGDDGFVMGIDNTIAFIESGRETYGHVSNLELRCADLFEFHPVEKYDLVVAARVLQWLNNPHEALKKLASFLKPGGLLSVLDYDHTALRWHPDPPESMQTFYKAFLAWRADAGMNNAIASCLEEYFVKTGFHSVQVIAADEVYERSEHDFAERAGIWSKVAELKQIVDEGYITEAERIRAVDEYNQWVARDAERMTMKLNDVRGTI